MHFSRTYFLQLHVTSVLEMCLTGVIQKMATPGLTSPSAFLQLLGKGEGAQTVLHFHKTFLYSPKFTEAKNFPAGPHSLQVQPHGPHYVGKLTGATFHSSRCSEVIYSQHL